MEYDANRFSLSFFRHRHFGLGAKFWIGRVNRVNPPEGRAFWWDFNLELACFELAVQWDGSWVPDA